MSKANTQSRLGILVATDGSIRFTKNDRASFAKHFAKVGIDINQIKTLDQFDIAWDEARPYFIDFLVSLTEQRPPSIERDLLIATVKGEDEKAASLTRQLDEKRLKTLIQ